MHRAASFGLLNDSTVMSISGIPNTRIAIADPAAAASSPSMPVVEFGRRGGGERWKEMGTKRASHVAFKYMKEMLCRASHDNI